MDIQTMRIFREAVAERGGSNWIGAALFQKRFSPTLATAIQDIFLEEDVNTELSAIRFGVELETVQLLPHRLTATECLRGSLQVPD